MSGYAATGMTRASIRERALASSDGLTLPFVSLPRAATTLGAAAFSHPSTICAASPFDVTMTGTIRSLLHGGHGESSRSLSLAVGRNRAGIRMQRPPGVPDRPSVAQLFAE